MTARVMTPLELRASGLAALLRELGPVGMVRFLQAFESGQGDYTRERHEWLGSLSIEEVAEEIAHAQRQTEPAAHTARREAER